MFGGENCLRYANNSTASRCSILIVSGHESNQLLTDGLLMQNSAKYNNFFQVNTCSSIDSILSVSDFPSPDFIVNLVNPCSQNWVAEVKNIISHIDQPYLLNRLCVVIDTSYPKQMDLSHLKELREKCGVITICGEIKRNEILEDVSQRILQTANRVCCNQLGIPMIFDFNFKI